MCGEICFLYFGFFFQAEDGIRELVRSRGLGDVYKRQGIDEQILYIHPHAQLLPSLIFSLQKI